MPPLSSPASGGSSARRRLPDAPPPPQPKPQPKATDSGSTEPSLVQEAQRLQGMLLGNQLPTRPQADKEPAQSESPGEMTPDHQPSVLDASTLNPRLPSGNPHDDTEPTELTEKERAVRFREEQEKTRERGALFSGPPESNASPRDQEPSQEDAPRNNPQRRTAPEQAAELIYQQQAQLARQRTQQAMKDAELEQLQKGFFSDLRTGASPQQFKETIVRVNRLLAAKSGIGLGWALFSANMVLVNKVFNSSLLPGYKSPKEKAAHSGMQFTDLVDIGIALMTNIIAAVYLLPVIGLLAAIFLVIAVGALGTAYLAPLIGDLVFQLTH